MVDLRKSPPTFNKRHQALLTFLTEHMKLKGKPPTYKEIAVFLGTPSLGCVSYWLHQLEDLGLIRRQGTRGRKGIEIKVYDLSPEHREIVRNLKRSGVNLSVIVKEWSLL
jgi:SOS-response transcriptional repressor LexA